MSEDVKGSVLVVSVRPGMRVRMLAMNPEGETRATTATVRGVEPLSGMLVADIDDVQEQAGIPLDAIVFIAEENMN